MHLDLPLWDRNLNSKTSRGTLAKSDIGGVPIGCCRHGEPLLFLSCNCKTNVLDLIRYVGEGGELARAVFSLARRHPPRVAIVNRINSLFEVRTSSHETGGAPAHQGAITEFTPGIDALRSARRPSPTSLTFPSTPPSSRPFHHTVYTYTCIVYSGAIPRV